MIGATECPHQQCPTTFPTDLITKALEKSSHALHDETIQKVVFFENWPLQSFGKSKPQSWGSGHRTSFGKHLDSSHSSKTTLCRKKPAAKPFQTPSKWGKGKKLIHSCLLCCRWEVNWVSIGMLDRPSGQRTEQWRSLTLAT